MLIDSLFQLETFVLIALLLKAAGYMVRDELVLRTLVVAGMICDVCFYALQPVPLVPPILSTVILISINLFILVVVVRERTTLSMSDRERRLFGVFSTLTPGQFRKLSRLGKYRVATERTEILKEGFVPTHLYYIEGNQFEITKGDFRATVQVPAFAGEVAYLTGRPASATVTIMPGTEYTVWSVEELRAASRRSLSLANALVARFSLDLAQKVTDSVPTSAWGAALAEAGAPVGKIAAVQPSA